MPSYLLFLIYLIFGIVLLHWIVRKNHFPFSPYHTAALFTFKVFAGCLYGYIFLHYYGGDDTWTFVIDSRKQTILLNSHPGQYINEFLPGFSLGKTHHDLWAACLYYVDHFEDWFMVKLFGVLNLTGRGNYYIDVLWFELLVVAGPLLLFRLMKTASPGKTGIFFLLIFFMPSISFWCSGIRAEGLILLFIAIAIYYGRLFALDPGWRSGIAVFFGLLGLLLFRVQYLVFLLPALLAYMASVKYKRARPIYFNLVYLVLIVVFSVSLLLPQPYQLSRPLIHAQQGFFVLHGNTRYDLDSLKPGLLSPFSLLPQALTNAAFRPFPWEAKGSLQIFSSMESLFLIFGLCVFFFNRKKKNGIRDPLYWLLLYYGVSQLIAIGYIVPFPGAIVRYRSIPLLFILLFLFSCNFKLQQVITARVFHRIK